MLTHLFVLQLSDTLFSYQSLFSYMCVCMYTYIHVHMYSCLSSHMYTQSQYDIYMYEYNAHTPLYLAADYYASSLLIPFLVHVCMYVLSPLLVLCIYKLYTSVQHIYTHVYTYIHTHNAHAPLCIAAA